MDVVKRSLDALRGSVEIRSEKGKGTTITLKIPLTLAIIDGLLVQIGNENMIIPLTAVEEYIKGIGKRGEDFIIIINMEKVFGAEELSLIKSGDAN
jgi:two-component system chemotaxis sensor kinase CheA